MGLAEAWREKRFGACSCKCNVRVVGSIKIRWLGGLVSVGVDDEGFQERE